MSALKKFLAKLEEYGPAFGELYGRGASKLGMSGLGSDIAGAAMEHPKTASILGGAVLPAAAGIGIGKAGEAADQMLPDEEMNPELMAALRSSGQKPSDYEAGHRMPFEGAVTGASIGSLANTLGRKGALAKYLAIGGGIGGLLGSGVTSYRRKKEE